MATGDALQVGMAVPLVNWRGAVDSDVDGTPDSWGTTGSASVEWRKASGNSPWGLSGLCSTSIRFTGSGDYVYLRSEVNSCPVPGGFSFGANALAYVSRDDVVGAPPGKYTLDVRYLDSSGSQVAIASTTNTNIEDGYWLESSAAGANFTADTAAVELRYGPDTDAARGFILDDPVVAWKADGSGGGLHTMGSAPSISGTSLVPGTLATLSRDARSGGYMADPYGARAKWLLNLNYEYMSEADYQYWLECYAINQGASGYKAADGGRLRPVPVIVRHRFWEPSSFSSGADGYAESGKQQYHIGNFTAFNLAVREHVGWGYQGSITIEEA